jgi:hypothetical protein
MNLKQHNLVSIDAIENQKQTPLREIGGPVALRHLRGPVSLTGGQSQASIFNDLGAWLQCAMEGEMVNQPTAEDRLIDRRSVVRTGGGAGACAKAHGWPPKKA